LADALGAAKIARTLSLAMGSRAQIAGANCPFTLQLRAKR
jgi:hypothetical protein